AASIVPLVRERVKLLPEARDMMAFFFVTGDLEIDRRELLGKAFAGDAEKARLALSAALTTAERLADNGDWSHDTLDAAYRDLAPTLALKPGDLFMLMRVALPARTVAPPLFETMAILGRDRCLLRLRDAIYKI